MTMDDFAPPPPHSTRRTRQSTKSKIIDISDYTYNEDDPYHPNRKLVKRNKAPFVETTQKVEPKSVTKPDDGPIMDALSNLLSWLIIGAIVYGFYYYKFG